MAQPSIAILAGGQSQRMGQDKALLEVGGKPLLQREIERLRALTNDLFLVTNNPDKYRAFGLPMVGDIYPGNAALGGIYTAVCRARHNYVFVVACDMPFLNVALIGHLFTLAGNHDAIVPRVQPHPETLHAIYSRACAGPIERRILAGQLKVIGFFEDVRLRYVERGEIAAFDPDFHSFVNVNTPEALANVRRLAAQLDAKSERP
ncbi:MAG: molybdenum cofactor guanylyltransferase [Anaerolineae bacterium]